MASYGDISSVEILIWGTTNIDYDTKATTALLVASDLIDSRMNNRIRIASPSSRINSAANLIAAAILASTPDEMTNHQWYKMAIQMIDDMKGTISDDADWNYQVPIQKDRSFPISPTNNQTWEGDW